MDFLDPKKRKSHQKRLLIGYALMAILVGMVSILLLLKAYGYTYNFRTGDISQNGLLFVSAHPRPATLYLNNELKGTTDKRLVLEEGVYNISLQREGYHNWERSVVLKGGVIERFQYPFLFPSEIESNDLELFSSRPDFATQSPDRQWLIVRLPGTIDTFEVLNLAEERPTPSRFELPEGVLTQTGTTHKLELVEWSTNNRHFVIHHTFSGGNEYILIDREQPTQSRNISEAIEVPFSSLRLRDKKFDSYYLYANADKSLKSYDLASEQVTAAASNVLAFRSHGDDELLYVTDGGRAEDKMVSLRMVDNGETFMIHEVPRSESYLLEVARYEGEWYLIAAPSSEEKVYVFRNPVAILRNNQDVKIIPEAVLRIKNASSVTFSQNTRIIAAQADSKIAVYDAEQKKTYHYDTKLAIAAADEFVWMDGHRLTAIIKGTQQVFDFDGNNIRSLGTGYTGSRPYFDRDYTAAFTIAPSIDVKGRAALQRTELVVEQDQ